MEDAKYAPVVKQVDTPDLGSGSARSAGSIPVWSTKILVLDFRPPNCYNFGMEDKVKESLYHNLNIDPYSEFIAKRGSAGSIAVGQLIDAIFTYGTGPKAIESLGRSPQSFNRNIKKLFPNVSLSGGGQSWKHWLISQSDYKSCSGCHTFCLKQEFGKDASSSDNLDDYCKPCKTTKNNNWYDKNKAYHKEYLENNRSDYNARNAKRRAAKLQATPRWANLEAIKEIYRICPKGYHVDHIVPLQGEFVCGLHVENNLQLLIAKDNLEKSNNFSEDMLP